MDPVGELRLLLASGTSLVTVETPEESRLLGLVRAAAGSTPLWIWSAATGLRRDGREPIYGTAVPEQMLDNVEALSGPFVVVLCDPAPVVAEPTGVRRLKELGQRTVPGQSLILVGNHFVVPAELDGVAHPWRLPLPDTAELLAMVERAEARVVQRGMVSKLDDASRVELARALRGLTLLDAEREVMALAAGNGVLEPADIPTARDDKAELLNQDGILEVVEDEGRRLADLGGLTAFKEWMGARLRTPLGAAREPVRGVLLTGVPGCGKSAVAHAVAEEWAVPLVLLDPGRIYRKYVGESEERFEAALRTVEAMAPAVLWIDEIEKGFATGGEDGGVTDRVLGTFLRWLQDRDAPVFVVATANDVTRLPPELTRKGRFDELFFVDLPDAAARATILAGEIHRRGADGTVGSLDALVAATEGFSGAEIAASVAAATYSGPLTVATIGQELERSVPLATSRPAEIASLRAWARDHARAA